VSSWTLVWPLGILCVILASLLSSWSLLCPLGIFVVILTSCVSYCPLCCHLQSPCGLMSFALHSYLQHGLVRSCHCSLIDVPCIVLLTCIALMTCKGSWWVCHLQDLHWWLMLFPPLVQFGRSRHKFNQVSSYRLVSSVLCFAILNLHVMPCDRSH